MEIENLNKTGLKKTILNFEYLHNSWRGLFQKRYNYLVLHLIKNWTLLCCTGEVGFSFPLLHYKMFRILCDKKKPYVHVRKTKDKASIYHIKCLKSMIDFMIIGLYMYTKWEHREAGLPGHIVKQGWRKNNLYLVHN